MVIHTLPPNVVRPLKTKKFVGANTPNLRVLSRRRARADNSGIIPNSDKIPSQYI